MCCSEKPHTQLQSRGLVKTEAVQSSGVSESVNTDDARVTAPSASEQVSTPETVATETNRDIGVITPTPVPRRSQRANAGVHSNPYHVPVSACHAITLSPEVLSQLLTNMGTALFKEAVHELRYTN